jgi:hypothetical protein
LLVFEQRIDVVVAQRGAVLRIVAEHREGISVIAVQAVLGGEPHEAVPVLNDRVHHALRQTILDGERPEWKDERVLLGIGAQEPDAQRHPHRYALCAHHGV